jgi:hypothetical protein
MSVHDPPHCPRWVAHLAKQEHNQLDPVVDVQRRAAMLLRDGV